MVSCVMIGDLLDDVIEGLKAERVRYPVRNREVRVQIDGRTWHLIQERDGGICWMCEKPVAKGAGEIDHLIPRSSFVAADVGLADRSWNLRLACVDCNQAKSNYRVPMLPRTVGVTAKCWDCFEARELGRPDPELLLSEFDEWKEFRDPAPDLMEHAYCGSCGLVSRVPDRSWVL